MAEAISIPVTDAVEERRNVRTVIAASSVGTLIEWYDFYIFGALATIIADRFYPANNPTASYLATLATFATGFIVRPFGALVFGRMGDLLGRKVTFLITLLLMGGSTFVIGLLPGYATLGILSPILLVLLRLLQGLALGGEYGGAATYVAEHAPNHRRGYYTAFIQTTATLGFFVSLLVILATRLGMGEAAFSDWGWRIPFLVSAFLVIISYYIRVRMEESPVFKSMKSAGKLSKNPLRESFMKKENLRMVLIALFGATAGQGVVWYTGQFYAQSFLTKTLNIDSVHVNVLVACALVIATPFFLVFGGLSDKIGRKRIIMGGMLLGILFYYPIYRGMSGVASTDGLALKGAPTEQITTGTDPKTGEPTRTTTALTTYENGTQVRNVTVTTLTAPDGEVKKTEGGKPVERVSKTVYPSITTDIMLALLVLVQVLFVTMVYGPIAAFLVELFPTHIRYTSMSLPYHIGNGVFGGLVPFISTALVVGTGNIYAGLIYPIAVAVISLVVGTIFIRNDTHVVHLEHV